MHLHSPHVSLSWLSAGSWIACLDLVYPGSTSFGSISYITDIHRGFFLFHRRVWRNTLLTFTLLFFFSISPYPTLAGLPFGERPGPPCAWSSPHDAVYSIFLLVGLRLVRNICHPCLLKCVFSPFLLVVRYGFRLTDIGLMFLLPLHNLVGRLP